MQALVQQQAHTVRKQAPIWFSDSVWTPGCGAAQPLSRRRTACLDLQGKSVTCYRLAHHLQRQKRAKITIQVVQGGSMRSGSIFQEMTGPRWCHLYFKA